MAGKKKLPPLVLPESSRILQNLFDVTKGKKHTPKATNPHPVHGKKPKRGKRK